MADVQGPNAQHGSLLGSILSRFSGGGKLGDKTGASPQPDAQSSFQPPSPDTSSFSARLGAIDGTTTTPTTTVPSMDGADVVSGPNLASSEGSIAELSQGQQVETASSTPPTTPEASFMEAASGSNGSVSSSLEQDTLQSVSEGSVGNISGQAEGNIAGQDEIKPGEPLAGSVPALPNDAREQIISARRDLEEAVKKALLEIDAALGTSLADESASEAPRVPVATNS